MTKKPRFKKWGGPRTPSIKIPTSPKGTPLSMSADPQSLQNPQSARVSPFQTPPTSPSTPVGGLPAITVVDLSHGDPQPPAQGQDQDEPRHMVDPVNPVMMSVTDIASEDVLAIADLFSTMNKALVTMSSAFDRLGSQTENMVSHSLNTKLQDQVCIDPTSFSFVQ